MRWALTASLAVAVLGLGVGVVADAAPRPPSSNVTAYAANGHKLPNDPVLRPGEVVRLVVTGFAIGADVRVGLAGGAPDSHAAADASGVVTVRYVRPPPMANGDYLLTFTGAYPPGPSDTDDQPYPSNSGDVQGEQVHVPNLGYFPFRVRDPGKPTPSSSATVLPTETATSSGTAGSGGLSSTGYDVVAALIIGATAVIAGVVVLRLGVRPRGRREPDQ